MDGAWLTASRGRREQCHIWYSGPMSWAVETLNRTVDGELDALPADMRARFVRVAELITTLGLPREIQLALVRARELEQ
jgi:hypothetical protein